MNALGKNLRQLRQDKGLSIRALSEKIGLSHNTLATYERDEVAPTIYNAVKLSEFFNVPIEYLIYGKKMIADFNDGILYKLFKKIDDYNDEDREIAKDFLEKLVKNVTEKNRLRQDSK